MGCRSGGAGGHLGFVFVFGCSGGSPAKHLRLELAGCGWKPRAGRARPDASRPRGPQPRCSAPRCSEGPEGRTTCPGRLPASAGPVPPPEAVSRGAGQAGMGGGYHFALVRAAAGGALLGLRHFDVQPVAGGSCEGYLRGVVKELGLGAAPGPGEAAFHFSPGCRLN